MKKFITTFFICLFLLFSMTTNVIAETKVLTQGLYSIADIHLLTGINYKVRNISTSHSLILIIDNNQMIQQLIRLEPNSPQYTLKPLNFGDSLIIIGASNLEFS